MSASTDIHGTPKRVLMLASNPSVSPTTGWPIGFWWAELTHPYWEFVEAGYEVTLASPDGGTLQAVSFSDPGDASGYSASGLISRGFIASPTHAAMVENTPALADVDLASFDAVFLVRGQAPMVTFRGDQRVKDLVGTALDAGKVVAVVCHATCVLLDATLPAVSSSSPGAPGPASPTARRMSPTPTSGSRSSPSASRTRPRPWRARTSSSRVRSGPTRCATATS